jgi:hypothetical protein
VHSLVHEHAHFLQKPASTSVLTCGHPGQANELSKNFKVDREGMAVKT